MVPTAFDEENDVLDPPVGMTQDEVQSLSVYRGHYPDGTPIIISCWKLTEGELDEIKKTGRIWLHLMGHTMPPACVSVNYPFEVK